jgi:hypothetical protein
MLARANKKLVCRGGTKEAYNQAEYYTALWYDMFCRQQIKLQF